MSDTDQRSLPRSSAPRSTTSPPARPAEDGRSATDASGAVRQDLENVRRDVENVAGAVKAEAESQLESVKDETLSFAEDQKDAAARQLSGIAKALRQTSEGLSSEQPAVASYTRSIAGSVERMSKRVEEQDVDSLIGMAEDYGRRQPAAMIGIAALAGFLSGRLLLASGRRRERRGSELPKPVTTRAGSLRGDHSSMAARPVAGAPRRETNG